MVRVATDADIPRVVELAQAFLVEAGYDPEVSAGCAPDQVKLVMTHESPVPLVLENPLKDPPYKRIDGFFGAIVTKHPINGLMTAFELAWYVTPEKRAGTGGWKLLKFGEELAFKLGADVMQLSSLDDKVGGFLQRAGYTARETTWVRSLG